jgi:hypothetical protein
MVNLDAPAVNLVAERGETLVPLQLLRECCVPTDIIRENLQKTFERGYRPFNHLFRGSVAIVGSGPSILETWQKIDPMDTVLACNAAHDFLIARGHVPHYAMFFDAAEIMASMFTPHKGVHYLIASRCHPKVFEKLKGFEVTVWHAGGAPEELILEDLEALNRMEPVVHGGSAAVVRAAFLVVAMGFRHVKFFGGDGSFEGEHTHFQKSAVPETEIRVCCNRRWFRTTAWLAAQAEEIPILFPILQGMGVKLEVFGDGLVPHIAETMGYIVHK